MPSMQIWWCISAPWPKGKMMVFHKLQQTLISDIVDGSEIWVHQLIDSLSHYLQGFIHPRWLFGISSINSRKLTEAFMAQKIQNYLTTLYHHGAGLQPDLCVFAVYSSWTKRLKKNPPSVWSLLISYMLGQPCLLRKSRFWLLKNGCKIRIHELRNRLDWTFDALRQYWAEKVGGVICGVVLSLRTKWQTDYLAA